MALHRLVSLCCLTLGVSLGLPSEVAPQALGLDARLGIASHGGGCLRDTRTMSIPAGLELRTRGRWIASTAIDLFVGNGQCLIGVGGWTDTHFRFRAGIALGYAVMVLGARSELVAGVGTIPTTVDDEWSGTRMRWYSWQGGTVTIRPRQSPISVQVELGRHRLPQRTISLTGPVPVTWQRFMRFGVSFPILG